MLQTSLCARSLPSLKETNWKEAATELFLGPLADISALFDPEGECRISKKAGLPVSSGWGRFFGGAFRLVSSPHIPVPVMASDKWLDTLECTGLQCNGDAALIMTLVFRYFKQKEGLGRRKE